MRSDNHDQTPQGWVDEIHEVLATPLSPTGEALDEGKTVFAKGGSFHEMGHGILFVPDALESRPLRRPHPLPMEVSAEARPITVFEGGWRMPTDQVISFEDITDWKPEYPLVSHPVSQTFPMTPKSFRQFHKILGVYLLPGDKPLIHKGKKP